MGIIFNSEYENKLDVATSEFLPEATEDIETNLEIADMIKSKVISAKEATRGLRRKLKDKNPNVQLLALKLVDFCSKNCGEHFLLEIASKEFVDCLVSMLETESVNLNVRKKVLEFIQLWAVSLGHQMAFEYLQDTYTRLLNDGYNFPPKPAISKAIFDTKLAPVWKDGSDCFRCRSSFSVANRKHHCRNCGNIFCGACSENEIELPEFGMNDPVRVCDSCFNSKARKNTAEKTKKSSSPSQEDDPELKAALEQSLKEYNNRSQTQSLRESRSFNYSSAPSSPPITEEATEENIQKFITVIDQISSKDSDFILNTEKEFVKANYKKMKLALEKLSHTQKSLDAEERKLTTLLERIKLGISSYDELVDSRIRFMQLQSSGNGFGYDKRNQQAHHLPHHQHPNESMRQQPVSFGMTGHQQHFPPGLVQSQQHQGMIHYAQQNASSNAGSHPMLSTSQTFTPANSVPFQGTQPFSAPAISQFPPFGAPTMQMPGLNAGLQPQSHQLPPQAQLQPLNLPPIPQPPVAQHFADLIATIPAVAEQASPKQPTEEVSLIDL